MTMFVNRPTRRDVLAESVGLALGVTLGTTSNAAEPARPVVPAGARLERLFTRTAPIKGGLTEGPAVAPDGSIYFSDIPEGPDKGMILRFDPATDTVGVFTVDSGMSNGLKFDAKGRLVACEGADHGGRCIARWDVKTGTKSVLADRYRGKRFNAPNDLTIDRAGRVYFTDPKYVGPEPRELEHRAVYRLDPDGGVIEITHAAEKPNGIVLSPDQKTLYVADTNNEAGEPGPDGAPRPGAMRLLAFRLDGRGLVTGNPTTLIDFRPENGVDGMTADVAGNLYLAVRSLKRPGVLIVDPAGTEVGYIPTGPSQPGAKVPTGLPSNVAFGLGTDATTLYVTVDVSLYRVKGLAVPGYHIPFEVG